MSLPLNTTHPLTLISENIEERKRCFKINLSQWHTGALKRQHSVTSRPRLAMLTGPPRWTGRSGATLASADTTNLSQTPDRIKKIPAGPHYSGVVMIRAVVLRGFTDPAGEVYRANSVFTSAAICRSSPITVSL